jgi:hypothetical protein
VKANSVSHGGVLVVIFKDEKGITAGNFDLAQSPGEATKFSPPTRAKERPGKAKYATTNIDVRH